MMRSPFRSQSRTSSLFGCLVLVTFLAAAAPASARLAVFVDGRVLKVTDAYLDGSRIVLVLADGGQVEVPAVRVDRVISDEVEEPLAPVPATVPPACAADWVDVRLPSAIPFAGEIERAARAARLNPWLLAALVEAESAFDPRAVSRAGACGLTQLMPAAAADQRVRDPFDPTDNLRGGAAHLRALLNRFGSLDLALAAYNAGAATVERTGGIPPYRETRSYVRQVLNFCHRSTRLGV